MSKILNTKPTAALKKSYQSLRVIGLVLAAFVLVLLGYVVFLVATQAWGTLHTIAAVVLFGVFAVNVPILMRMGTVRHELDKRTPSPPHTKLDPSPQQQTPQI